MPNRPADFALPAPLPKVLFDPIPKLPAEQYTVTEHPHIRFRMPAIYLNSEVSIWTQAIRSPSIISLGFVGCGPILATSNWPLQLSKIVGSRGMENPAILAFSASERQLSRTERV